MIDIVQLDLVVQKGKKIKSVHIVDVPGHPRLKPEIDKFLPQAGGIIFVVDALDFMPQVRQTAEYCLSFCPAFTRFLCRLESQYAGNM
jgi:signal recognition particle receptor subunit beta